VNTDRGDGLVLIGYRAAGKTTLGRRLADRLRRRFRDADQEFETRHGAIAAYFDDHGEPLFRDAETTILRDIRENDPGCILATGGGAIIREDNRALLRAHGFVVWLNVPPRILAERLRAAPGGRPPLTPLGLAAEVELILQSRIPLYRQTADLMVEPAAMAEEQLIAVVSAEYARFVANRAEPCP
jgi:shikimate kinase